MLTATSIAEGLSVCRKVTGADQALWTDLRKLWKDLARSKLTFWDNDDDEEADGNLERLESTGGGVAACCL